MADKKKLGEIFDPESEESVAAYYRHSTIKFTQNLIDAISASASTQNIPAPTGRHYWASLMHSRCCGYAISMHRLMPSTPANIKGTIYDFAPVAALARSLFECLLVKRYLCDPTMSHEEYSMRLQLAQLHDSQRRPSIIEKIGKKVDKEWYNEQANILRESLEANPRFQDFPEKRRRDLLKGGTPQYLSQDELLAPLVEDLVNVRGFYEFLSSHVHTYPVAYMKIPEHGARGTGRENIVDKGYLGMAADYAGNLINQSTIDMKILFDMVPEFDRRVIDWDTNTHRRVVEKNSFSA
jgi:hypothetical protein